MDVLYAVGALALLVVFPFFIAPGKIIQTLDERRVRRLDETAKAKQIKKLEQTILLIRSGIVMCHRNGG